MNGTSSLRSPTCEKENGHIIHLASELAHRGSWPSSTMAAWHCGRLRQSARNVTLDKRPKRGSRCAKGHGSLWHIRKTNSSRVLCHRSSVVCCFLPGDKASDLSNGSWQEVGQSKTLTRVDQRVWQVTGASCCLLDRVAGSLFFPPGWAALRLKHRREGTRSRCPLLARHEKLHTARAIQLNFPL